MIETKQCKKCKNWYPVERLREIIHKGKCVLWCDGCIWSAAENERRQKVRGGR